MSMMRVEFFGDWLTICQSPDIDGVQAGYNARLDAGVVAIPSGWRFYLDPCPGGMTRVINQILMGEQPVTPPPHLSVYRGGGGTAWFGEIIDFPDPKTPGELLGHAAYWIKRIRRAERAARQALPKAEGTVAIGLCRLILDECGKISIVFPRDDDGEPVEMTGERWVHRAAFHHFHCYITRDYDLIPA